MGFVRGDHRFFWMVTIPEAKYEMLRGGVVGHIFKYAADPTFMEDREFRKVSLGNIQGGSPLFCLCSMRGRCVIGRIECALEAQSAEVQRGQFGKKKNSAGFLQEFSSPRKSFLDRLIKFRVFVCFCVFVCLRVFPCFRVFSFVSCLLCQLPRLPPGRHCECNSPTVTFG